MGRSSKEGDLARPMRYGSRGWLLLGAAVLVLAAAVPAAALEIAFSGPTDPVPLGAGQTNAEFEIRVWVRNLDGLAHPQSGLQDFVIYFNQYDITGYFLSEVVLSTPDEAAFTEVSAVRAIPAGLLPEDVYWLSAAVRSFEGDISAVSIPLQVGNPTAVSPEAGDTVGLRQLIEDPRNRLIRVPAGTYHVTDATVLRLKDGQMLIGEGSGRVTIDGSGVATPELSPILVQGNAVSVAGLTVWGNPSGSGVAAKDAVDAFLCDVVSSGHAGGGIVAYDGARVDVVNGHLTENAYDGVTAGRGGTATVVMSFSESNRYDGFGAEQEGVLAVDFSLTRGNSGVGYGLFTGARGSLKRTLSRWNGKAGVFCGEGATLEALLQNRIVENGEDGIGLLGPGTRGVSGEANVVERNGSGLTMGGGAVWTLFRWNWLAGNTNSNVSIIGGSVLESMSGNTLIGSKVGIGVSGDGSRLLSLSDTVEAASQLGVLVTEGAWARLEGTTCRGNTEGGVSVTKRGAAALHRVSLTDNSGFGLGVNDVGSSAVVTESVIQGNGNYGAIVFESAGASLAVDAATQITENRPADIGKF